MAETGGDKTEAPTPKRRSDAAKKGDVLQSREVGVALAVVAGTAWLALAGPWAMAGFEKLVMEGLRFERGDIVDFAPGRRALELIATVILPLAALLGMTLLAAIAAPALLGSLGFRGEAMAFKGSRIDPLQGIKRIFGAQGLIELAKSIVKVALLGAAAWWVLDANRATILHLGHVDPRGAIGAVGGIFIEVVVAVTIALVVLALADVPLQIAQRTKKLRMSKQEVKDEHKQTEGSPELKAALRQRQYEMARNQSRGAVKEATVVLVNPTHFAVALCYRPGEDEAPVVVARGRGVLAEAIRDLAAEADVPVLRYPMLARAIYYTARTGQQVRDDLFIAVAAVLAFVFNLDAALAEGRSPPEVDVPEGARFDEEGQAI